MTLRDALQEARDLGVRRTLFRVSWEARRRLGLLERFERPAVPRAETDGLVIERLPFSDPAQVVDVMRPLLTDEQSQALTGEALYAARGTIRAFGHTAIDYGQPIDWYRHPLSGDRYSADSHWSRSIGGVRGDVKFMWEIARFNHAPVMARAAVFDPSRREELERALEQQVDSFVASSPYPRGMHWFSGLELAIRVINLLFARAVLGNALETSAFKWLLVQSGEHLEEYLSFSRYSAYNDHLIGEAAGLLAIAAAVPSYKKSARWRDESLRILREETKRQFFSDGGYFAQSHNYHRAVLQFYEIAQLISPDDAFSEVLGRSAEFLHTQQNQRDGRLPNFGSNDGGLPLTLTVCDIADYRPTINAASCLGHGATPYQHGPWSEEALWLRQERRLPGGRNAGCQPAVSSRTSHSYRESGLHILRSATDQSNFATFRCGDVTERFTQIDMLHVDLWWYGHNLLVDPGTYLYNGETEWLNYFVRTGNHNTIKIDDTDQMLHYRQFKMLYWTKAKLLTGGVEESNGVQRIAGEHYGYVKQSGTTHRRSIAFADPSLWVIVDRIEGAGEHHTRLHWMLEAPSVEAVANGADAQFADAPHAALRVFDAHGAAVAVKATEGFVSRYYGEKAAATSLSFEQKSALPQTFVTVVGESPSLTVTGDEWRVSSPAAALEFRITSEGTIQPR